MTSSAQLGVSPSALVSAPVRRKRPKRKLRPVSNTAAIVWTVITGGPLLWMLYSAFKTAADIAQNRWSLPHHWTLGNFAGVWTGHLPNAQNQQTIALDTYVKNSVVVTGVALFLTIALAGPTAYALARYKFPGRKLLLLGFVLSLAIPVQSLILPIWYIENKLNITDTYPGLILPYVGTAIPFGVLLLTAYFRSFPTEVEQAARIDGLGDVGIFTRIVLPLSVGPISAIAVLLFNGLWNEFLFALILMPQQRMQTLPVGVVQFTQSQYNPATNFIMATLVIVTIPVIAFYLAFNRKITSAEFVLNK